jgi:PilZ domain
MTQGAGRRRFPRIKAKIPVELRAAEAGICSRALTQAISLGGCYVETISTFQPDTKLQMTLQIGDEQLNVRGRVATCYPPLGKGIEFTEMAPEDQIKLAFFIAKCEL